MLNSFRDLIVWQKGMLLVEAVYKLTETFPKSEQFGLISQIRRCAVSIPSNIAEGRRRGSRNDFNRFLSMSVGSGAELETQLEIALRLKYLDSNSYRQITSLLEEIIKMLTVMSRKLKATSQ